MSNSQLTPAIAIPERAIQTALKTIVESIAEVLEEEAKDLASEWAQAAEIEKSNIFMQDATLAALAAALAGYIEKVQPRAHQFTAEHVEAYMNPLPLPPATAESEALED